MYHQCLITVLVFCIFQKHLWSCVYISAVLDSAIIRIDKTKVARVFRSRLTQSLVLETPQKTQLCPLKYDILTVLFCAMDLPLGCALTEKVRERERERVI